MHNNLFLYLRDQNIETKTLKEKTIDYLLRSAWMHVHKMYSEEASKKNSTMATGFALINLNPEKGTPSTTLYPKMGIESTSVSRTLKSMEKKGLIKRRPNPEDGRSVLIFLTPYGQEMREYSKFIVRVFDEAVRENISEQDLATFINVAETIIDLINNNKIYNNKSIKHA